MMNKEEVRQYWRHQKRMAALKVFLFIAYRRSDIDCGVR